MLLIKARWGKWLLAGLATVSLGALSVTVHADTQNVQDNANVLSAKTERYIDKVNNDDMAKIKGRPQIAVITEKHVSSKYDDIEDQAQALFNKYKFGRSGYDNGVLFLIATKDHKFRMQTGYGIESVLPDAYLYKLLTPDVKKDFKQNDFNAGVTTVVKRTSSKIVRDQKNLRSANRVEQHHKNEIWLFIIFGIFIIGFAGIIFAIILSDEGGGSGSGGFFSGSSSDSGSGFSSGGDFGGDGGLSGGGGADGSW